MIVTLGDGDKASGFFVLASVSYKKKAASRRTGSSRPPDTKRLRDETVRRDFDGVFFSAAAAGARVQRRRSRLAAESVYRRQSIRPEAGGRARVRSVRLSAALQLSDVDGDLHRPGDSDLLRQGNNNDHRPVDRDDLRPSNVHDHVHDLRFDGHFDDDDDLHVEHCEHLWKAPPTTRILRRGTRTDAHRSIGHRQVSERISIGSCLELMK